jgi:hypothetical protein
VNLSWGAVTPPANCAVTYSVYRSTVSGFTPSAATLVASGLTAASSASTGLAASTTYYFVVQAVDAVGSTPSAQASATTQAVSACTLAPAAPGSVVATATSSSAIGLSWAAVTPPASCAVTYGVYRSTTAGFTPSAANQVATGLTATSFASTGLTASTTYYFVVQAVDAAGATSSAQASATTTGVTAGACHVDYTLTNSWPGGFQAALTVQNTGTTAWTSWALGWTFAGNQQISSLWNGTATQTGAAVTVKNLPYNGSVPAAGSVTGMGFTGSVTGTNAIPTAFTVNGAACN